MKKFLKILVLGILVVGLIGCGGQKEKPKAQVDSGFEKLEQMIYSSAPQRPSWTMEEPNSDGTNMYFVGLSDKHATERGAREAARRDASKNVVAYLGTAVKDKFQEITTSYGLSSDITDPTTASKGFAETLSAGVSKRLKVRQWYLEKWQTKMNDIYFKVYALAAIPKSEINKVLEETVEDEQEKLKEKIKKEKNEQAKQQMQDALQAFEQFKNSGIE